MTLPLRAAPPDQAITLDLLCVPEGEAYRIYVWPHLLPEGLIRCLDEHGELYPAYLDLEELERAMAARGAEYTKRETSRGGFELTADGLGAQVLTQWLTRMFQSGSQGIFD